MMMKSQQIKQAKKIKKSSRLRMTLHLFLVLFFVELTTYGWSKKWREREVVSENN
jgi:hypothetical protein